MPSAETAGRHGGGNSNGQAPEEKNQVLFYNTIARALRPQQGRPGLVAASTKVIASCFGGAPQGRDGLATVFRGTPYLS